MYVANHYLPSLLGTIQTVVKITRLYPNFGGKTIGKYNKSYSKNKMP